MLKKRVESRCKKKGVSPRDCIEIAGGGQELAFRVEKARIDQQGLKSMEKEQRSSYVTDEARTTHVPAQGRTSTKRGPDTSMIGAESTAGSSARSAEEETPHSFRRRDAKAKREKPAETPDRHKRRRECRRLKEPSMATKGGIGE